MIKLQTKSVRPIDTNVDAGFDLAQECLAAYEGLMTCCAELEEADACISNIQNCISIIENVGGKKSIQTIDSCIEGGIESLCGISVDKVTTDAALESLGEKAHQAWEWFCKKVREFWDWVVSFFTKKNKAISSHLDELKTTSSKAAAAVKTVVKKEAVVKAVKAAVAKPDSDIRKVAKFGDNEALLIQLSLQCGGVTDEGKKFITSVKSNGTDSAVQSAAGKFNSGCDGYYKITLEACKNKGASIVTKNVGGVDYRIFTVSDFEKFFPVRESADFIAQGWSDSNLAKQQTDLSKMKSEISSIEEFIKSVESEASGINNLLAKAATPEAQNSLRNMITHIRQVAAHASNSASIYDRCIEFTRSNCNDICHMIRVAEKISAGQNV